MHRVVLKQYELVCRFRDRVRDESGQGMMEYALIAFLIAIAASLVLAAVGFDIEEVFDAVENAIGSSDGEAPTATPGDGDVAQPVP